MKTTWNRRGFLKAAGASTAFASLSRLNPAKGDTATNPPLLLHVICDGGWDTTAVFEDKSSIATVATAAGNGSGQGGGNISYVHNADRTQTNTFFSSHGGNAAIINGIESRGISHKLARKETHSITLPASFNKGSGRRTDYASFYALQTNPGLLVPHIVLNAPYYAGALGGISARLDQTMIDQFGSSIAGSHSLSSTAETELTKYLNAQHSDSLLTYGENGLDAEKVNNLSTSYARHQGFESFMSTIVGNTGSSTSDFERDGKLALELMAGGYSQAATISCGDEFAWDSHRDNHDRQTTMFEQLFSGLNSIISYAGEKSLESNLMIVVTSELGRHFSLNDTEGKDHWPYTSSLLWSPLINGGTVVGVTDNYLRGLPISVETGLTGTEDAKMLDIRDVWASVYYTAGVTLEFIFGSSVLPLVPLIKTS